MEAFARISGLPVSAMAVSGAQSAYWSVVEVAARTVFVSTHVS